MKFYRGMYKEYFDLANKQMAVSMAAALRDSVSTITPNLAIHGADSFIVYCDEMLRELTEIRSRNQKIDRLTGTMPTVAMRQFLRQAMIEEIHQTNEMENIHSTRKEIGDEILVIENGQKGKRFDGMIRKYALLLRGDPIPLGSCQDIRNLFNSFILDEVMKENPQDAPDGVYFRRSTVSVVKQERVIHEGVYPEAAINEAMEHALDFLNDEHYDPLIRVAAFHYMFGYIHPFYNGNGRMTRFISSAMLVKHQVHLLVALRLSYVIKSHRAQYYNMFRTTNDKRNFGDMTRFVIEFLSFMNEASEQVLDFLAEKERQINHYGQLLDGLSLDETAKKLLFILIQVSVCDSKSLSLTELSRASEVTKYKTSKSIEAIKPFCLCSQGSRSALYRADLEKLDSLGNG